LSWAQRYMCQHTSRRILFNGSWFIYFTRKHSTFWLSDRPNAGVGNLLSRKSQKLQFTKFQSF
jgi:hypothetical protein